MPDSTNQHYILGLDLGVASVGWACIAENPPDHEKPGEPAGILTAGVRVFEAGVDNLQKDGKGESWNTKRREARQVRRQTERRWRRKQKLFGALQRAGLLPSGSREELGASELFRSNPYALRAAALQRALTPQELGRALYHLGQRRGFLSNRKTAARDAQEDKAKAQKKKEQSKVLGGIANLAEQMAETNAPTLGAYLHTRDPHTERHRGRYAARGMYLEEFEAIWDAQAPHHPAILTDDLKRQVHRAIFHQRPLKSQKHLIGPCELEEGRPRAPWLLLDAQRFRMLQKVNDLSVEYDGVWRDLTDEERRTLVAALDRQGELKFTQVRKILGLQGHHFSHEAGGETKLPGNRTNAKLRKIFGDRWWEFSPEDRDRIVEDVHSIQKDEALAKRGRETWGLDEQAAKALGNMQLEEGYCGLSRQAIFKLLPLLENGVSYSTARRELYPHRFHASDVHDVLPPLTEWDPTVRNPVVARTLTELRHLVNDLVDRYGKPEKIRIELARDLKNTGKERQDIWKKNRARERERQDAADRILKEIPNFGTPSRNDKVKVLLADECDWTCPYTGRHFGMRELLGDAPTIDVEHIIPFPRCLDDSFANKTLCDAQENRHRKRNRTPFEAYAETERWDAILERVRKFAAKTGNVGRAKLRRFKQESVDSIDEFASRQLNDTRYASRLAGDYLALLYGGRSDEERRQRIQIGKGQITYHLRGVWGLNGILNDGDVKTRDDHRHHAVDAIAIALTGPGTVQMLSRAAGRAPAVPGRPRFDSVPEPWAGFLGGVRATIEGIVVSHRVSHSVNGALHEETFYSPPRDPQTGAILNNGAPGVRHVRKPLAALSAKDVEAIVDPRVRRTVQQALAQRGGTPAKVFADPTEHPTLPGKGGGATPIHSVRIRVDRGLKQVGSGPRARHVWLRNNHHLEIVEVTDRKGRPTWEGKIVTRYEALRRKRAGEPVIQRDHGPGTRLVCSLAGGDTIQLDEPDGTWGLYIVRTVSEDKNEQVSFEYAPINDARKKEDMKKAGAWRKKSPDPLRKVHCQKVLVTRLGEVRRAND